MTNLHERIAEQLNKILIGENELPAWMTYGHTILCQKDVSKEMQLRTTGQLLASHLCGNY